MEDNGLGIDLEKNGDKLFGQYNTFPDHPDSRGNGLFITKNQVDAMGGSIEVEMSPAGAQHSGFTLRSRPRKKKAPFYLIDDNFVPVFWLFFAVVTVFLEQSD